MYSARALTHSVDRLASIPYAYYVFQAYGLIADDAAGRTALVKQEVYGSCPGARFAAVSSIIRAEVWCRWCIQNYIIKH